MKKTISVDNKEYKIIFPREVPLWQYGETIEDSLGKKYMLARATKKDSIFLSPYYNDSDLILSIPEFEKKLKTKEFRIIPKPL